MASSISPEEIIKKIEEILCDIGEPFVRRIDDGKSSRIELNYPQSRRKQTPKWLDSRAASHTAAKQSTVPSPGIHVPEPTQEQRDKNLARLNECLKDLETRGVPSQEIRAILSRYDPALKRQLTFYVSIVRDVHYLLTEEKDWRRKLLHHVRRIEFPPLPESLKQSLVDDSLKALGFIEMAIKKLLQAQTLLAPIQRRLLRKGSWFSQARKDLNRLMEPAIKSKRLSRRLAAQMTFELLKALAPEDAPASAASIRSGSYDKKEIKALTDAHPLPSP